ncbi:hypothetical protein ACH5RR_021750 [Cinchona calisaya]|uniref:Uncharacterized protein n=1 Tax=Cinchona calisaya TaxID=153742 RepID=A0ABD2ZJY9_9GENT
MASESGAGMSTPPSTSILSTTPTPETPILVPREPIEFMLDPYKTLSLASMPLVFQPEAQVTLASTTVIDVETTVVYLQTSTAPSRTSTTTIAPIATRSSRKRSQASGRDEERDNILINQLAMTSDSGASSSRVVIISNPFEHWEKINLGMEYHAKRSEFLFPWVSKSSISFSVGRQGLGPIYRDLSAEEGNRLS